MPRAAAVSLPESSQNTGGIGTQVSQLLKNIFKHRRHLRANIQEAGILTSAMEETAPGSCSKPGE